MLGDSLILEGVRASLASCPALEVIILDQPLGRPLEEIAAHCPAAIIFDTSAIPPDLLLSLFQQPGLLVGIDPETHLALVWSGRQEAAGAATDIMEVILGSAPWAGHPANPGARESDPTNRAPQTPSEPGAI